MSINHNHIFYSIQKHKQITGLAIKYTLLFICIIIWPFLMSCKKSDRPDTSGQTVIMGQSSITKSDFLLNTLVSITIYDKQEEKILKDCLDLIRRYEIRFSRTNPEAEVYAINHGIAPHDDLTFYISNELSDLLQHGLYYSNISQGAFDITIAPITELWNFTAHAPIIPEKEAIEKAISLVNYQSLRFHGNELTFDREGMSLDFGGIAKGYIADRAKDFLIEQGVKSALINLGGNILCVGRKPDGSPFRIGIQKPFADRNETIAIMELSDLSVVSSGIYERFFIDGEKLYHHILDPKTGYPINNNLTAVTIISKHSVDGDGLSTTCFSLGLEAGLKLIESLPDTYAVFLTSDDEIHYSKGFREAIQLFEP